MSFFLKFIGLPNVVLYGMNRSVGRLLESVVTGRNLLLTLIEKLQRSFFIVQSEWLESTCSFQHLVIFQTLLDNPQVAAPVREFSEEVSGGHDLRAGLSATVACNCTIDIYHIKIRLFTFLMTIVSWLGHYVMFSVYVGFREGGGAASS